MIHLNIIILYEIAIQTDPIHFKAVSHLINTFELLPNVKRSPPNTINPCKYCIGLIKEMHQFQRDKPIACTYHSNLFLLFPSVPTPWLT